MAQARIARRVRIAGRVQGVGFRLWAERAAAVLGLDGWVRNRRDGTVEAVFAGPPERVEEMIRRCHEGPPLARVDRIEVTDEPDDPGEGFFVLPTV